MEQIIEQYGKAIIIVISILLLIAIVAAVLSATGNNVFSNLINDFMGRANNKANLTNVFNSVYAIKSLF